ncbi:MAG: hypothetical protein ABMA64_09285 [Myxococcota bacterium]
MARERELRGWLVWLERGPGTLCLTGEPGIGKSWAAEQLAARWSGTAWRVDLRSADPEDPWSAVAAGADLQLVERTRLVEALAGRAGPTPLLWLDDADGHPHLARLEQEVRSALPDLRVLVTARRPIGLAGERVDRVEALAPSDAEALFAALAGVPLDAGLRARIAALDGNPLAVTLMAARVRALGLGALDQGPPVTGSEIDRSWRALDPEERRVLAHPAGYPVVFDLETARWLGADTDRALASLVERSLVRTQGPPDDRVFTLPHAVRDFAQARIEDAGQVEPSRRDLAQRALGGFTDGPTWALHVDRDAPVRRGLLEEILRQALSAGDALGALRAGAAVAPLAFAVGRSASLFDQLASALALPRTPADRAWRARGHAIRARIEARRTRYDQAIAAADRAVEEAREVGGAVLDWCLVDLAEYRGLAGQDPFAALSQVGPAPSPRLCGAIDLVRGLAALAVGDPAAAECALSAADRAFHSSGDELGTAVVGLHWYRALRGVRRGDEARAVARRVAESLARLGHRLAPWMRLQALEVDDLDQPSALVAAEEVAATGRRWVEPWMVVTASIIGAYAAYFQADEPRAVAFATEALALAGRAEHRGNEAIALSTLLAVSGDLCGAPARLGRLAELLASQPHLGCHLEAHQLLLKLRLGPVLPETRDRAERLMAALASAPTGDAEGLLRVLRRTISALDRADKTVVGGDGSWFERGGARVELAHHGTMQRILGALAAGHRAVPGAFLGADELFEAGWPGQRATVGSARARVYTTVHRLRKLGLGLSVRSGARGFALDPDGVVIRDGNG